jgi:hypothetical protein
MLSFLKKYSDNGGFYFFPTERPFLECNAPNDKSGVYLVYAVFENKESLVYIGSSGKMLANGEISIRGGLGGIKGRLIEGRYSYKQDGKKIKMNRAHFWIAQMYKEKILKLKIYWFVTHSFVYTDCPLKKDAELRALHRTLHGRLPAWNRI